MSFEHQRGEVNTVMLSVLRLSGSVPSFPTDYSTPQLRITHVNGGGEIEDLALTSMAQLAGANRWFHKFSIPLTADFTKYLVTFKVTIEGVATEVSEEFKVIESVAGTGTGANSVTVTVKSSVTMLPISNAIVRVFDKATPTAAIAVTETDSQGNATIFLDAGDYLIEFSKTGVISETHTLTVNADGSHNVEGD